MLIRIILAFLYIGLISFGGGYASIPLIQSVIVEKLNWINLSEMADIITISQLTPGPIAINSASFVGMKLASIPGAIVATLANITPQFILLSLISLIYFKNKKINFIEKIMIGLRPAVVGLIIAASLSLFMTTVFYFDTKLNIDFKLLVIFLISLFLAFKRVSIYLIILLSAILILLMEVIR